VREHFRFKILELFFLQRYLPSPIMF